MAEEAKALPSPPTDGVSALSYFSTSTSSSLLASSSWDGCIRVHNTRANTDATDSSSSSSSSGMTHELTHNMECGPLLSMTTPPSTGGIITGGLNGAVKHYHVETASVTELGRHGSAADATDANAKVGCSCLASLDSLPGGGSHGGLVASAGWDRQFHLWDARTSSSTNSSCKPVVSVELPGKAFSMDAHHYPTPTLPHSVIVLATSGRRTCFIDVRKPTAEDLPPPQDENDENTNSNPPPPPPEYVANMVQDRESSLKYQTRCVRFFPDGTGLALGSIEGRVAIEYLDNDDTDDDNVNKTSGANLPPKKKYAFKCHRLADTVYPVNCLAFHPIYGTFATGGCDGGVVLWDGHSKKRLASLPKFGTSIAALAFDEEGKELAIAASYTFEEGEREHPREEVFVRRMGEGECRPKKKS